MSTSWPETHPLAAHEIDRAERLGRRLVAAGRLPARIPRSPGTASLSGAGRTYSAPASGAAGATLREDGEEFAERALEEFDEPLECELRRLERLAGTRARARATDGDRP